MAFNHCPILTLDHPVLDLHRTMTYYKLRQANITAFLRPFLESCLLVVERGWKLIMTTLLTAAQALGFRQDSTNLHLILMNYKNYELLPNSVGNL